MVRLVFRVDLGLSVVEIVDFCHSRQSSGDFESGQVRNVFAFVCIAQEALRLIVWLRGQKQISKLDKAKQSSFLACDLKFGCAFRIENRGRRGTRRGGFR